MNLIVPSSILIIALIDDLRSQKVHNGLILVFAGLALLHSYYFGGLSGLQYSGLALLTAFALLLPLFMIKAVGGGDVKLMMAFGLATEPITVMWVLFYSLIFGALFGTVRAVISGEGLSLLQNTLNLAVKKDKEDLKLHKIPFTIALLFGWLTHVSLSHFGGGHWW